MILLVFILGLLTMTDIFHNIDLKNMSCVNFTRSSVGALNSLGYFVLWYKNYRNYYNFKIANFALNLFSVFDIQYLRFFTSVHSLYD